MKMSRCPVLNSLRPAMRVPCLASAVEVTLGERGRTVISRAITFTARNRAEIGAKRQKADERLASADRGETPTARLGRLPRSAGDRRWRARTEDRVPPPLADDSRGHQAL